MATYPVNHKNIQSHYSALPSQCQDGFGRMSHERLPADWL